MLTALSVGRECKLVRANQQVISVKALPPQQGRPASLLFQPTTANTPVSPVVGSQDKNVSLFFFILLLTIFITVINGF